MTIALRIKDTRLCNLCSGHLDNVRVESARSVEVGVVE